MRSVSTRVVFVSVVVAMVVCLAVCGTVNADLVVNVDFQGDQPTVAGYKSLYLPRDGRRNR